MDTWNTISHASRTRLDRALLVLETLCNEEHIRLLETLREREKMTLAELYLRTGETRKKLEKRMDALCKTGCVIRESATIGSTYRLNPEKIDQINSICWRINRIREDALQ